MRSIMLSVIFIGLVLAGVGYGTWSMFTEEVFIPNNNIWTGTLTIFVRDSQESADGQWILYGDAYPGLDPDGDNAEGEMKILNIGTLMANHTELRFGFKCYEDDDGNVFVNFGNDPLQWNFTIDPSKWHSGPDSDTNLTGVGKWLDDIVVTDIQVSLYEETLLGQWILKELDLSSIYSQLDANGDGDITFKELSEGVLVIPFAPAPTFGDEDISVGTQYVQLYMKYGFKLHQNNNELGNQNDWQGDVCEMVIQAMIVQTEDRQWTEGAGMEIFLPSS